jgi:hypothetical protein
MTSIGSVVTSLTGMEDIDDAIDNAIELGKSDGLMSKLKDVANELTKLPVISSNISESTKNFSNSLANISSLSATLAGLEDLDDMRSNALLLTGVSGGEQGLMKILGILGSWFNSSFAGDNAVGTSVLANVTNMKSSIDMVAQMNDGLENISDFADNVEDITARLTEAKMQEFEGTLTRIVEHVRMINTALMDLDKVNINTTIDRFGNNMRVAKQALSIAGGAVNVNVQLNMTINAEKISQALVLGGFVKPSQDYANELQTDYKDNQTFDGINNTTRDQLATSAFESITKGIAG